MEKESNRPVKKEDVEGALEYFLSKNDNNPGAQRLRIKLGGGNVARIQAFKDEIIADRKAERRNIDQYPLPEPISQAAHSLYTELLKVVEDRQIELEQDFEDKEKSLVSENERLSQEVATLSGQNETLKAELTAKSGELDTRLVQVSELEASNEYLNRDNGILQDSLAKLEITSQERITEANQQSEKWQTAYNKLETTHEKESKQHQVTVSRLEANIDEAQKERRQVQEALKETQTKWQTAEQSVTRLETELTSEVRRRQTLESDLSDLRKSYESVQRNLKETEASLGEVKVNNGALTKDNQRLMSDNEKLTVQLDDVRGQLKDMTTQLNATTKELIKAQNKIKS